MAAGRTIRVLVVDDHDLLADSLVRVLDAESDIDVVGRAATMAAAIDVARTTAPEVVVMDYGLPDGDGVTAAQRIREHRPESLIVVMTGLGDERVLLRAVEAGCSGFVTKDRGVQELLVAIRTVVAGEAYIPAPLLARLLPQLQPTYRRLGGDLTRREVEVLALAAEGLANRAIADSLHVSVHTVRNHVQNAIAKLQAHSKLEAVAVAVREGIVRYPAR